MTTTDSPPPVPTSVRSENAGETFSPGPVQYSLLAIVTGLVVLANLPAFLSEPAYAVGRVIGSLVVIVGVSWALGRVACRFGNLKAGRRVATGLMILFSLGHLITIGVESAENREKERRLLSDVGDEIEKAAKGDGDASAPDRVRAKINAMATESSIPGLREGTKIILEESARNNALQKEWITLTAEFGQLASAGLPLFRDKASADKYLASSVALESLAKAIRKELALLPGKLKARFEKDGIDTGERTFGRGALNSAGKSVALQDACFGAQEAFFANEKAQAELLSKDTSLWSLDSEGKLIARDEKFRIAINGLSSKSDVLTAEVEKTAAAFTAYLTEQSAKLKK